jgi:hypothetical protein
MSVRKNICDVLKSASECLPNQRICQIISNAIKTVHDLDDIFYIEDDQLFDAIKKYIGDESTYSVGISKGENK